jgi:hypothetical protein
MQSHKPFTPIHVEQPDEIYRLVREMLAGLFGLRFAVKYTELIAVNASGVVGMGSTYTAQLLITGQPGGENVLALEDAFAVGSDAYSLDFTRIDCRNEDGSSCPVHIGADERTLYSLGTASDVRYDVDFSGKTDAVYHFAGGPGGIAALNVEIICAPASASVSVFNATHPIAGGSMMNPHVFVGHYSVSPNGAVTIVFKGVEGSTDPEAPWAAPPGRGEFVEGNETTESDGVPLAVPADV